MTHFKRLYLAGWPPIEIARKLRIDRTTAAKYAARMKSSGLQPKGHRCPGCGGWVLEPRCHFCAMQGFLVARRELGLDPAKTAYGERKSAA